MDALTPPAIRPCGDLRACGRDPRTVSTAGAGGEQRPVAVRVEPVNRIKGPLFTQGIFDYKPLRRNRRARLEDLSCRRSASACGGASRDAAVTAGTSAQSAAIASRSLRPWPTEVTPILNRSTDLSLSSTPPAVSVG